MERWWKVPLAGEGRKPRLHRRHRVYKLVEDTKHRPKDNLELVLTQSVEGKARTEILPISGWSCLVSVFFFFFFFFFCLFDYFAGIISSLFEKREP